jgi:thiol-disulfide isomerase/thioredoxin
VTRIVGRLLPAAMAVVAVAGCSTSSSGGSHHGAPSVNLTKYIAEAKLAPCPVSSATSVPGGLPNLTLACLGNGPAVHLSGLKGPAVVNVWGSWCTPCKDEASYLSSVYRSVQGKVTFLGIDTEDESDSALTFGATQVKPAVRYPSVVDADRKFLIALAKAPGPPETVFVGTSGKVVHVHLGEYFSAASLRSDIATYLNAA